MVTTIFFILDAWIIYMTRTDGGRKKSEVMAILVLFLALLNLSRRTPTVLQKRRFFHLFNRESQIHTTAIATEHEIWVIFATYFYRSRRQFVGNRRHVNMKTLYKNNNNGEVGNTYLYEFSTKVVEKAICTEIQPPERYRITNCV